MAPQKGFSDFAESVWADFFSAEFGGVCCWRAGAGVHPAGEGSPLRGGKVCVDSVRREILNIFRN